MAVEMANIRQLPGLSHRPNFPHDLHVLLLDPDFKARQEAESQLRENHYSVTPCSCSVEAATFLANPENSCDVLLADVRCLQQKSAEHSVVVQAAKLIPLVLMSESGAPNEVMLGIKLGAVDFLEKPLSPLKLKNIWQHSVRRMLSVSSAPQPQHKKGIAASGTASPEHSGSQGAGPGTHSHGSGGESGSHASTSDQALAKIEYEMDMETSSMQEAMGCIEIVTAASMAREGGMGSQIVGDSNPALVAGATVPDPMLVDGTSSGKPRPQPLKYKATRISGTAYGIVSGNSCGPKPAIGQPAGGKMPPLPSGIPGIEWGLPTNPLQISPKTPLGGLLGPMGWPGGSFLASPLFPLFLGSPTPSATSGGCCVTLPLSNSCLTLSSGTNASLSIKRCESAPLPAVSSISSASAGTSLGVDGLLQAPIPARATSGSLVNKAELFNGLEAGKPLPPPIGLNLKKSPSLADLISQSLVDGSPAT